MKIQDFGMSDLSAPVDLFSEYSKNHESWLVKLRSLNFKLKFACDARADFQQERMNGDIKLDGENRKFPEMASEKILVKWTKGELKDDGDVSRPESRHDHRRLRLYRG